METTEAAIEERIRTLFNRTEALEHKVDGNGQPGIVSRMAVVETQMALHTRLLWTILAAVLGVIAELIARRV
ncbi:MAG: hypothetical protein IJ678_06085 [Kiritimatiellae bacterium]|nr:hypothetical protein [Kiritimatiellia bacterium]